jgi:hypothetical protein
MGGTLRSARGESLVTVRLDLAGWDSGGACEPGKDRDDVVDFIDCTTYQTYLITIALSSDLILTMTTARDIRTRRALLPRMSNKQRQQTRSQVRLGGDNRLRTRCGRF